MFLSLPAGTEMFQFPAFAPTLTPVSDLQSDGLPHSDISGSIPVCSSPELFAAYHVLLRLRKPRHPPYALVAFFPGFSHFRTSSNVRRKIARL